MAGKYHTGATLYAAGGAVQVAPGRLPRAYAEGFRAASIGGADTLNPHVTGSDAFEAWVHGFNDSFAGVSGLHVADSPADLAELPPEVEEPNPARKRRRRRNASETA